MSLVLILLLTCAICYFISAKWKTFVVGSRIPGPRALPLIGNVQMLNKLKPESLFQSVAEFRARFGETYRLWLGPELWVFLHSPQETREALNDPTLKRPATFQQLSVLIGNGLLISHGKPWETHRRALNPAFHPQILSTFTRTIALHGDELVKKLLATNGQPIEVSDSLFACILDAIIEEEGIHKQRRTLLDTLLMTEIDGEKLTRGEICDEGVDTTTAAMCFVLYSLGKYPAEQRKLLAEIQEHSLEDAELTAESLNRLEYLDIFLKEVLRYYTTVPLYNSFVN